ncbi:hypothetical protein H0H92_012744, partial [Tricholoma furcatifolium]
FSFFSLFALLPVSLTLYTSFTKPSRLPSTIGDRDQRCPHRVYTQNNTSPPRSSAKPKKDWNLQKDPKSPVEQAHRA